jgi:hypothetical protein
LLIASGGGVKAKNAWLKVPSGNQETTLLYPSVILWFGSECGFAISVTGENDMFWTHQLIPGAE